MDYIYSIRVYTNNIIKINFLNFLYQKQDINVMIDNNDYSIYIQIKNKEDFDNILEIIKEYYDDYNVKEFKLKDEPIFI